MEFQFCDTKTKFYRVKPQMFHWKLKVKYTTSQQYIEEFMETNLKQDQFKS